MRPIKYTWHVWRTSKTSWFVLLIRKNDGLHALCRLVEPTLVDWLKPFDPMPDVRLFVPSKQVAIPVTFRAIIWADLADGVKMQWI